MCCKLKRFNCDAKSPCADNCALLCRLRKLKEELCDVKRKLRCLKKTICRAACPTPKPAPCRTPCDPCSPCTSFPPTEACDDPCIDPCAVPSTCPPQTDACDPCAQSPEASGPCNDYPGQVVSEGCDTREAGFETSGCEPCAEVDPCDDPCASETPPCGLCDGGDPCSQFKDTEGFSSKIQYLCCKIKCLDDKLKKFRSAQETHEETARGPEDDVCAEYEDPCDECSSFNENQEDQEAASLRTTTASATSSRRPRRSRRSHPRSTTAGARSRKSYSTRRTSVVPSERTD